MDVELCFCYNIEMDGYKKVSGNLGLIHFYVEAGAYDIYMIAIILYHFV